MHAVGVVELRQRKMADVAGMNHKGGLFRHSPDLGDGLFEGAERVRIGRQMEADMAIADLQKGESAQRGRAFQRFVHTLLFAADATRTGHHFGAAKWKCSAREEPPWRTSDRKLAAQLVESHCRIAAEARSKPFSSEKSSSTSAKKVPFRNVMCSLTCSPLSHARTTTISASGRLCPCSAPQARRNVHAFAEQVSSAYHDVADVDPDAKANAAFWCLI